MPSEQPIVPRFSISLKLLPVQLEQLYCQSAIHREAVRAEEISALICCLLGNAAVVKWLLQVPARFRAGLLAIPTALCCAGVAQFLWYIRAPSSFLRNRRTVQLVNRLARAATLALLPLTVRALLPPTPPATPADLLPIPPPTTPPAGPLLRHLLAVHNLMLISGGSALLLQALHTTLPFPAHLLAQTACTLLLLTTQAAPATHLLKAAYLTEELRSTCTFLGILFLFTQVNTRIVGITANLDHACYQHPEELLVAFAIIYCGWVLPLYLCIRSERFRRHQFLLQLTRHRAPSLTPDSFRPTSPASPPPTAPPSPPHDTPSAAAAAASIGTAPVPPSPSTSSPRSLARTHHTGRHTTSSGPHGQPPSAASLSQAFLGRGEIHTPSQTPSPPAPATNSPSTTDSGEVTSRLSNGARGVEVAYDGMELPRSPVIDTILALVLAGVTWGAVVCGRHLLLRLAIPL